MMVKDQATAFIGDRFGACIIGDYLIVKYD